MLLDMQQPGGAGMDAQSGQWRHNTPTANRTTPPAAPRRITVCHGAAAMHAAFALGQQAQASRQGRVGGAG